MTTPSYSLLPPRETSWNTYIIDIPADLLSIPERVLDFADKTEFKQKDEYHVTLLGRKIMALIEGAKASGEIEDTINEIPEWQLTPRNKFYLLAKRDTEGNTKQSIVQIVELPQIEEFYEKLAKEKILDAEFPPAHVTLFTKYDDDGIAIYSQDDFDDYLIREIY